MDTDAAGIYHWTTIVRFVEDAEAELHTALGIDSITFGATPRVKTGFEFHRPLQFNDTAVVELAVAAVGRTSVRYRALVSDDEGRPVAEAEVTTVFIDTRSRRSAPWPETVRAALAGGGDQQPSAP